MALTDARSIINRSRATTGATGIDILKYPLDIDVIPHKFIMNFKKRSTTISMSDFGAAVKLIQILRRLLHCLYPLILMRGSLLTINLKILEPLVKW